MDRGHAEHESGRHGQTRLLRREDAAVAEAGGAGRLLRLQRSIGNAATAMLVQRVRAPRARRISSSHARDIATGHSWRKHVEAQNEFPEIRSKSEFKELIIDVVEHGRHAYLSGGRDAYYDRASNTLVILNPNDADGGTCFRPNAGKSYFDNLQ